MIDIKGLSIANRYQGAKVAERRTTSNRINFAECLSLKTQQKQNLKLPIETKRYKIEDASAAEGVPAYRICNKQNGNSLYIRADELAIQKDSKTGMEFIINMDQPFSYNVMVTEELRTILGEDIPQIPMQGGLTVNQDPKTGLQYLAIEGNESQGVSVLIKSEKDKETLENLADEFMNYSVVRERSIAGVYALWEIGGNLRRGEEGFAYLTPSSVNYIPYDGSSDKAWVINMSKHHYDFARKSLAQERNFEDLATWENMLKTWWR